MEEPLYLRLANSLETLIRGRALRPGDKVPSVRQFSREQRVSVPTALNAFATLENRGLIEARPKSGYYVCSQNAGTVPLVQRSSPPARASALEHSDPMALLTADRYDREIVQFGLANAAPELLPGAKLGRILAGIARRQGAAGGNYDHDQGSLALRAEISRRLLTAGVTAAPDDVLVTAGATEAVTLALRATCQPGDTVIVESPTFFGLLRQLRELQLKALPVAVDPGYGMCLDDLARAVARKGVAAIMLNPNFQNPVGFSMPDVRRRELLRLAMSRGLPVIEDDICGDLPHRGPRPRAVKAFDEDGSVLLCSSFSKTIAPGYRVGYIAAGKWQARVNALKKTQSHGNAMLPGLAIAEFLRTGGYDRYLRRFRECCRQQVARMSQALAEAFPAGIRLSRPTGGYILWCELPPGVDSMLLFDQARSNGISLAPGPLFSTDGGFRNFVRISCGFPWSPTIERAVGIVGHLVHQQAGTGALREATNLRDGG